MSLGKQQSIYSFNEGEDGPYFSPIAGCRLAQTKTHGPLPEFIQLRIGDSILIKF
jgi:hypothetical protein